MSEPAPLVQIIYDPNDVPILVDNKSGATMFLPMNPAKDYDLLSSGTTGQSFVFSTSLGFNKPVPRMQQEQQHVPPVTTTSSQHSMPKNIAT